ncbi:MAG: glycosyltransferase family 10 domain-containing protein [Enterocloster sp.]
MENLETGGIAVLDDSWHKDKRNFLQQYKFTIAFENVALEGSLTSEKLYDPIHAYSIPIYWGDPNVAERFNKEAFINCNDYDNDLDKVVKRVIELDQDDEAYMYMLGSLQ